MQEVFCKKLFDNFPAVRFFLTWCRSHTVALSSVDSIALRGFIDDVDCLNSCIAFNAARLKAVPLSDFPVVLDVQFLIDISDYPVSLTLDRGQWTLDSSVLEAIDFRATSAASAFA